VRQLTAVASLLVVVLPATSPSSAVARRAIRAAPRVFVEDFSPSWSPDGKRIVFTREREVLRNGECCIALGSTLYVINVDGSRLHRIPGSGHDADPTWSPDGSLIAFTRRHRLYVMRPDGSGARAVRGDFLSHRAPSWSPDGKLIAFWRGTQSGGIYVIGVHGTGFRPLTTPADPYGGASWAPDGRRLAFARNLEIYLVTADASDVHRLTGGQHMAYYEPSWSPDNVRLSFRSDRVVYVMRSDGTGIRRITHSANELAQDTHPVWSLSGTRLAFSGYRGRAQEARIYTVAPNGQALRRVTKPPSR